MNKRKPIGNVRFYGIYFIIGFLFFVAIIARISYLALSDEVDGINLQNFAKARTTKTDLLYAKRGSIYDKNGDILAQNVSSYTLIAYLSEKRTTNPNNPQHVVDKEDTAEKLAPILGMKKEDILKYLNKKGLYQTEFGSKGRGITELVKDKIDELNLPGIDFIETQKRYYPFGSFLSYTLGYAKVNTIEDEDGNSEEKITGEMGIEKQYNDLLSGKDGYVYYQKDRNGYKIADTPEIRVDQEDGNDIYLTIDSEIQLFAEDTLSKLSKKTSFDWATMIIADAKTGAILATATSPSFNPNTREKIPSYLDYNISYAFEPGSTMKTYTYMAVMENGNYNGKETFKSGTYTTKDGTVIGDWDRDGWGNISFDRGYGLSSNVGIINLIKRKINGTKLKDYFKKIGFGSKTGIELANESSGKINFKYETEIYNAGFGQGITTTPIQHIKALTTIANDGIQLQPYIISKIVDPNTKEVIQEGTKKELGRVAKKSTTDKMKNLMYNVVNTRTGAAGYYYHMEGYDLIGKTGTAQVAKENGGGYYKDITISSFAGMWPKDDPQVIIYIAAKNLGSLTTMTSLVKNLVKNTSNYLNIYNNKNTTKSKSLKEYTIDSYINKKTTDIKEKLEKNKFTVIVIGTGDKIINQYPSQNSKVTILDKIFLLTSDKNYVMEDIKGWSLNDVRTYCNFVNIKLTYEGTGFVKSQSIKQGAILDKKSELIIKLENKSKK